MDSNKEFDFKEFVSNSTPHQVLKEETRESIMIFLETKYKDVVTQKWGISDIIFNGDKAIIKWYRKNDIESWQK